MIDERFDKIIMEKLIAAQEATGLSGREFAKRVGMPNSTWSAYYTMVRSIQFDNFKKICNYLGLDYIEVFQEAIAKFLELEKKAAD